jgi:peptidoglycan/LPS O-acetylase OafA/YrhL
VAVLLVVLYHAGIPQVPGGFVGVDVFFVISGFVITGVLLRERELTGRTSLAGFYARRARRILPAATVVIVATLVMSYHWLGFVQGDQVASDAKAAGLFFANFHFIALGTNYLTARLPPSPLQHYWSLSVEEQFYLLYPMLFALALSMWRRAAPSRRLVLLLLPVILASFTISVAQTSSDATAAYFSPFARAWELALGALVAVASPSLLKLPRWAATGLGWAGAACVVIAAMVYSASTDYPGYAVALPVVGAAAVIAGGTVAPRMGAELLLGVRPMQWLGSISYSLYLWHWPVLIVAEEESTTPLSLAHKVWLLLVALVLSVISYLLIENPVRRSRWLARRNLRSLAMGAALITVSLSLAFIEPTLHP